MEVVEENASQHYCRIEVSGPVLYACCQLPTVGPCFIPSSTAYSACISFCIGKVGKINRFQTGVVRIEHSILGKT